MDKQELHRLANSVLASGETHDLLNAIIDRLPEPEPTEPAPDHPPIPEWSYRFKHWAEDSYWRCYLPALSGVREYVVAMGIRDDVRFTIGCIAEHEWRDMGGLWYRNGLWQAEVPCVGEEALFAPDIAKQWHKWARGEDWQ